MIRERIHTPYGTLVICYHVQRWLDVLSGKYIPRYVGWYEMVEPMKAFGSSEYEMKEKLINMLELLLDSVLKEYKKLLK